MNGYVEKETLEAALNAGAAADSDSRRRAWAKAICILHDAPDADVVPVVHGRWEPIIDPYGDLEGWICNCGRESKEMCNYCPNCGAKMDG